MASVLEVEGRCVVYVGVQCFPFPYQGMSAEQQLYQVCVCVHCAWVKYLQGTQVSL